MKKAKVGETTVQSVKQVAVVMLLLGLFVGRCIAADATQKDATQKLEEVTVTGTHIRSESAAAPAPHLYTRADIEQTGYSSVSQFMESVPQNFSGSSPRSTGGIEAGNSAFGTAVNLRGLGADTTLVLVNGHRIAPSGLFGAFADVSAIPLGALDRIEVLADGSSAVYGSDAVAGVVNYILRDEYSGTDTALEYGTAKGDASTFRAAQSISGGWQGGSATLSYERLNQNNLQASDRSYALASAPGDLTPESRQDSVFTSLSQGVTDAWRIRGTATYSDRESNYFYNGVITDHQMAEATQYAAVVENEIDFNGSWQGNLSASYGRSNARSENMFGLAEGTSILQVVDAVSDGELITIPSGTIRAALGGQYRREKFKKTLGGLYTFSGPQIDDSRNVAAAFVEIQLPITSSELKDKFGAINLNLAGRYEDYSDFGDSFNPKASLSWAVTKGVTVRGSVGSSFKAPSFQQLEGEGNHLDLVNSPDPTLTTGTGVVLYRSGDNADLDAQEGKQWSIGIDIEPVGALDLIASISYFKVSYRERIDTPDVPFLSSLADPLSYGAFIERNPSSSEIQALVANYLALNNNTGIRNFTTLDPLYGPPRSITDVTAIVDNRTQNFARSDVDGIDADLSYRGTHGALSYSARLSGTYLLGFENVARPGATPVSSINTLGRPVDFRIRATGAVQRGGLGASLTANYVNGYWDRLDQQSRENISSWTTLDFQIAYSVAEGHSRIFEGAEVSLSVLNIFDKDPPFVSNTLLSLAQGYDAANANPLGRNIVLTIRKSW